MMKFTIGDIPSIAKIIIDKMSDDSIFTFEGPLGVGKTTLIKEILKQCGVKEDVTSPTFAYVKVYNVGDKVYNHFDLYRLNTQQDFLDLGFDEDLFDEDCINLIEWPSVIYGLLDDPELVNQTCKIRLSYDQGDDDARFLEFL